MFGKNPVRKQEHNPQQLQVHNIWYTLQGEGPYAGRPAVFCRLTGCNLRCWFCDTQWGDDTDPVNPVGDVATTIIAVAMQHQCDLVVLTGGEPVRQDLSLLLPLLLDAGLQVQIETAGTLWQECLLLPGVTIVVSPKSAKLHPLIHQHAHAFKYVIQAGTLSLADGLPEQSTQQRGKQCSLARPRVGAEVYLSPCDLPEAGFMDEENLRNVQAVAQVALAHGYIAGLQLQKVFDVE